MCTEDPELSKNKMTEVSGLSKSNMTEDPGLQQNRIDIEDPVLNFEWKLFQGL